MLEKLNQLGIKVWRPFKVVSLKPSPEAEERVFEVQFESGDMIQARYVIGADGAHSVVCLLYFVTFFLMHIRFVTKRELHLRTRMATTTMIMGVFLN